MDLSKAWFTYPEETLIPIYKKILFYTKGRGERTLAKLDTAVFQGYRRISIGINENVSFVLPPDPHFFKYLIRTHEQHITNVIKKLINPGDTVIDIGANIGYFSAYLASAVGKQGNVFCLEPEAKNFSYLNTNCKLLNEQGFNCFAYQLAASSHIGEATLSIHQYSTHHSIENDFYHLDKVKGQQKIHTVTLDSLANKEEISHISLLKIDTEGHESEVLQGARGLFLSKAIDYTILECRSEALSRFIDNFSEQFELNQLVWNGQKWCQTNAQSLSYKTECLLSLEPISSAALC